MGVIIGSDADIMICDNWIQSSEGCSLPYDTPNSVITDTHQIISSMPTWLRDLSLTGRFGFWSHPSQLERKAGVDSDTLPNLLDIRRKNFLSHIHRRLGRSNVNVAVVYRAGESVHGPYEFILTVAYFKPEYIREVRATGLMIHALGNMHVELVKLVMAGKSCIEFQQSVDSQAPEDAKLLASEKIQAALRKTHPDVTVRYVPVHDQFKATVHTT